MNFALFVIVIAGVAACSHHGGETHSDCLEGLPHLARLSPEGFDQMRGSGWRMVAEQDRCKAPAADLIRAYRRYRAADVEESGLGSALLWHEGQLRAMVGQTEQAVALMEQARSDGRPEWDLYIDATIGFLRRDRDVVRNARAALVELPEPEWFKRAAADAQPAHQTELTWPMNLDVIDGLLNCFNRPYAQAYEEQCRPGAAAPR